MNPLKQGLKQLGIRYFLPRHRYPVKEVNPLKQGLKHHLRLRYYGSSQVKEVNPLKQGLKRAGIICLPKLLDAVKEVNPLKQGLKHPKSNTRPKFAPLS